MIVLLCAVGAVLGAVLWECCGVCGSWVSWWCDAMCCEYGGVETLWWLLRWYRVFYSGDVVVLVGCVFLMRW